MTDKIVVLCTCATEADAERIAGILLDARLAACVNIIPRLRSLYRWKGAVESAEECLLLIKSSRALFETLRGALEKAHTYEVPEVVALPIVGGARNYLNWMTENLQQDPKPESETES